MRTKTILTLVVGTLVALPLLAASPNLLSGGGFDGPGDTTRWQVLRANSVEGNNAAFGWIGIDALASPTSGAMTMAGSGTISQCVPVTAGQAYDFGARILVTTRDHLKTPTAFLRLSFFADGQCATQPLAEATTGTASLVGRFTAVSATAQVAPQGAHAAVVTVVMPQANLPIAPGANPPSIYIDDTFLRLSGDCAPDGSTLCFARGTMRARVNVINADGTTTAAQAIQTSPTTGYFALDGVDQPDVTIKTYDFAADGPGARWFVVGGLTNQKLQITVEDVGGDDVRTYTNAGGQYLEPIVDAFFAP